MSAPAKMAVGGLRTVERLERCLVSPVGVGGLDHAASEGAEPGHRVGDHAGTAVAGLSHLETLVPAVQALGRRHAGYGVKAQHYASVGSALLWTLEKGLGDAFTPAVKDAWATTYIVLSTTMMNAANEKPMAA